MVISVFSYASLYFCGVSCNVFPFIYIFICVFLFFYCCAGYIVTFTKVLTIYQIYHNWILPMYHSPSSKSLLILFTFKKKKQSLISSIFSFFSHLCIIFLFNIYFQHFTNFVLNLLFFLVLWGMKFGCYLGFFFFLM
jgi:hypothetical protein